MVDILIGLLVFLIVAGIVLVILKIVLGYIARLIPVFGEWTTVVLYIAYAIIAIAVLVKYVAPLLKLLLSGRF
jgi:hypothetical protein